MARTRIAGVRVLWSEDEVNEILSSGAEWDLLGAFPHPAANREIYYVLVKRVTVRD